MSEIILALPVFFPILSGVAMLLRGLGKEEWSRKRELFIESLVTANSLLVAAAIAGGVDGDRRLVLFRLYSELTIMFKLDRMGSVFAGLVAFLWPLATLYAFEYMKHEERKSTFFAFYTITYGITMGIALAGNLVTLYLFYEMLTLVTLPLVLFPLTTEAVRAGRTYLYYSIGGAAFAFVGLVFVLGFSAVGTTEFVAGGMLNLVRAGERKDILLIAYVLAFFGFGVKAALFPCYRWLPKAAVAPTPVTALLHAVAVVKSGAFAILRLTYFSFGTQFLRGTWAQWVVMAAALVTIGFGSTMAVKEVHWKRRLAYSTVSNLSYILFGATLMTPFGLAAALSHLVIHAFMKICAFFCAGAVMHQSGKTYIYELDGMGKKMPITFGCLLVSSLSLMGIPLFAGFISKWNLAQAAFDSNAPLAYTGVAVILYSALMTGIYMMTVMVRAYFPSLGGLMVEAAENAGGPHRDQTGAESPGSSAEKKPRARKGKKAAHKVTDPSWKMTVPLVIFAAAILLIGLHPAPLMRLLTMIGGEAG